jgi:TrmH family RNA methyltransferase
MNETIVSKNNQKVKDAISYKDGKGEYCLVEGFHSVQMAKENGLVIRVFSLKGYVGVNESYIVNEDIIKKLSSTPSPEGIVALCKKKNPKPISSSRILYLDRVQDPGNVGTLLRTALAFGFHDVMISKGCASVYSSKLILSSQGAVFSLNILEGKDDDDVLALQKENYRLIVTDLKGNLPPEKVDPTAKFVLILGNVGKGVNQNLLSNSDLSLKIPMGGIDSLNVAVAGGILMYAFRER